MQTFPWWGAKYHLVQPLLLIRHHHNHLDNHDNYHHLVQPLLWIRHHHNHLDDQDNFHHLDMLEPTVKWVESALLLDPMIYMIDDWPKQTQDGKIIRLLVKVT